MEDHSSLKLHCRAQQSLGTSETVTTQGRPIATFHDRLKPEMHTFSFTDLHHQNMKNIRDISPKRSGNFLKQCRKATQDEELVKYMSNLPSFLERGAYRQEKVINVGVLDWSQLEKWQYSQKQILQRNSRRSLSSGYSSSSLSTEESSANSSCEQSCSPAHQRLHRRSLQFHLSSPTDILSQDIKSLEKFQCVKGVQTNRMIEQEKFIRMDKIFPKYSTEIKLDNCHIEDLDSQTNTASGKCSGESLEAPQKMNAKTNTRTGDSIKTVNKLQGRKPCAAEQDVSHNTKRVVLHQRDLFQADHSQFSEPTTMSYCKEAETIRQSFSETPESSPGVVSTNVPPSCPLICENNGCTDIKWCFTDAESIISLPHSSRAMPVHVKRGISPSRGRVSGINKSSPAPVAATSKAYPAGLELKPSKAAAEKPRSTSPFRRLSIGMGKISKTFSSKEDSSRPNLNTTPNSVKSAPENSAVPFCQSTSSDFQNATSRARASPLRRLLDPLLKHKAPNCHQSEVPLQKDSAVIDGTSKLTRGKIDSSTGTRHPGIVKFDMASCREINIDDSSQEKKHGSSSFQAFLRVAVKHGQPLFTFAVGNEQDVLAATMKKLSSSKEGDYTCTYTFFAVKEVRKKNGMWINQSSKDKSHDYIPNIVAQLKVSGSQFSQSLVREFVLFSVDLRHAEHQTLNLQENDELAAIIVRIPNVVNKSTEKDWHRITKCNDFPELSSDSTSGNSQRLISTRVILPSGVHSLPSKGGPSSLIQRWRSGGSCDCGGWDLGCKLRIFTNDSQQKKKSSSSEACLISDKFELISQDGESENRPVFTLAPYKDGIYSVKFTSFSVLQAFSLCIAVLEGRKPCETKQASNLIIQRETSLETILAQNDGIVSASNMCQIHPILQ